MTTPGGGGGDGSTGDGRDPAPGGGDPDPGRPPSDSGAPSRPGDAAASPGIEEGPGGPFRSWGALYATVITWMVAMILLLWLFTVILRVEVGG